MITWRGQQLDHLPRAELEAAMAEAVGRLMTMQRESEQRSQADIMLLSAMAGAAFVAVAICCGLLLGHWG